MVKIILSFLLFQSLVLAQSEDNLQIKAKLLGYDNVSIINLVANPTCYQDKIIKVRGYFCCGPEEAYLFLTKEHSDYCDWDNSIVVRFSDPVLLEGESLEIKNIWPRINGTFIDIIGIFNSNDHGHAGDCAGSISSITNVNIVTKWRNGKKWLKRK